MNVYYILFQIALKSMMILIIQSSNIIKLNYGRMIRTKIKINYNYKGK